MLGNVMFEGFLAWLFDNWIATISILGNIALGVFSFIIKRALDERDAENDRIKDEHGELRRSIDSELVAWGVAAIERMSSAHLLLATRGSGSQLAELKVKRDDLQSALSALVDRGRLYFPNHFAELDWPSWRERPSANKGFRDPILDALMISHDELRFADLENPSALSEASGNLFEARRAFISRLQEWLLPRRPDLFNGNDVLPVRDVDRNLNEVDWNFVEDIVDDYERRHGKGSFWKERPKPRAVLLAALNEHNKMSAKV